MRTETVRLPARTRTLGLSTGRWLRLVATVVVAIATAAVAFRTAATKVDVYGWGFFNTGASIVARLDGLRGAIEARDSVAMREFYAPTFRGSLLGLTTPTPVDERDGTTSFRFQQTAGTVDAPASLDEWRRYFKSFAAIAEARVTLERIDRWNEDEEAATTVNLEVIGTLADGQRSVIDRVTAGARFTAPPQRRLASLTLVGGERVVAGAPQFIDVGAEAGIAFVNSYYPPFLSEPLRFGMIRYGPAGITAADYDNDGFYDLFIPDGVDSRLFRNMHDGRFEDVTAAAGLSGLDGVSVALFADYDNDGHKDLFVSRTFKPNQLFHNKGDGSFVDVTARLGIGADCCTTVASWADYDNDGYLDLYVGRYLDPRADIPTTFYARNGEPNQLYHNDHDGTSRTSRQRAGVGETDLCLGAVWGDYDDDGYPDLYVVNDFGRKTLYRNNGDGTFTDVTVKTSTLAYGAGMSATFADYDNDGLLDIY